jgi:hypothetical protein
MQVYIVKKRDNNIVPLPKQLEKTTTMHPTS